MHAMPRRVVIATVAALSMTASLAACGSGGDGGGESTAEKIGSLRIGLLLPDDHTARFEAYDRPLITERIKDLCAECTVEYANAKADPKLQQQQVDTMIEKEVDAIILDAVDSESIAGAVKKADDAGIPVVAYDRLAHGPLSGYTSFDNEDVGKIQAKALLKEIGSKASQGEIVMLNGWDADPNSAMFKKGALSVLEGKVKIGKSYDVDRWLPQQAGKDMAEAISLLGKSRIVGVYSANDGMAGGAITALKNSGFTTLPPVTGQDAELAGVQRVLSGEQSMTIYKPFDPEATAAAEMALALGRGEEVAVSATVDSPTNKDIPAQLITPILLTKDNIKDTVVKDGMLKVSDICTAAYATACKQAGLR
ncbi:sugar ABC transporter substrate-binding protein [Streptomyces sp. SAJ15]|uniref:sugar ABC transporter substrate-binding protein n=1 Tax=Streptomyces sp. SAJ15 TaxID=2011095 RepID=UPI001186DF0A|nr:substrate-binding domain-containing protein [Streptomyces sp. SAJ15]TVL93355.1 ABC transporter substrate-binding protein [Streptomyces sp. SAJ15]